MEFTKERETSSNPTLCHSTIRRDDKTVLKIKLFAKTGECVQLACRGGDAGIRTLESF